MTTIFQPNWWIASRTMWFNLIVSIFALAAEFVPVIQPYVGAKFLMFVTVANLVLRILTQIKQEVTKSG